MASPVRHSAPPPAAGPDSQDPPSQAPGAEPDLQVKKLSPVGLIASGAAAATATVVGGQLGIGGTVVGAALTSVVSATALALYTDSVTKSTRKLKEVAARGRQRPQTAPTNGVHSSRTAARRTGPEDSGSPLGSLSGIDDAPSDTASTRRRIVKIALLAAVIALIGIGAVFGIQRITGTELSPGTGEIQRSVTGSDTVSPRGDSSSTDGGQDQQDDAEQGDGQAPDTDAPDDSGQGAGTQQGNGNTTDQDGTSGGLDDAPNDQPNSPAGQGEGSSGGDVGGTSEGGSSGSGGTGSGE